MGCAVRGAGDGLCPAFFGICIALEEPLHSMNRLLSSQVVQIVWFLVALAAVHLANVLTGMWFTQFGVIPRSVIGLRGILFSPLLHGNWAHLVANGAPLGVMLGLLAFTRGPALWTIVGAIWLASGAAVWLVGRPGAVQIGASGLIYGLAAFLLATAWLQRDLKSGLAALIVLFLYGGIAWGLLPVRQGVSWEGHLAGAIAGILIAMAQAAGKR
jgi:membrane associated rhomboid family serine protease